MRDIADRLKSQMACAGEQLGHRWVVLMSRAETASMALMRVDRMFTGAHAQHEEYSFTQLTRARRACV
jgi:hypothetical protein